MPFFLDGNPTQGEISEAINYLLGNFSQSVSADPNTGQVIGPGGEIQYYLYKYMFVKYADSFDGTVGFSNTPTNKSYYGLRNSDDSTESTNPVDYIWTQVSGGFGTTKFLYYLTTGGRAIQFQVATSVPNAGWKIDPGTAIDLDVTLATNSVANFVVIRVPNVSTAPTDAECISAIGRTPISGDLCTINYNSGLASIQYKYTTGWAIFQKYITADIVQAQTLSAFTANLGTVNAGEIIIGSSPTISGTGMTGSGAHIYADGRFALGNSTANVVFDGTNANINGFVQQSTSSTTSTPINIGSTPPTILTFSSTKNNANLIGFTGSVILSVASSAIPLTPVSINYGLYFYLYTASGTFIQQFFTGYQMPVTLTGSTYDNTFAFNLFIVKTLPANSYKLLMGNTQYPIYYNSANTGAYCTSTATHYIQGFSSQYQATV